MKNYIRYEIQERKYSPNVIIGIYQVENVNKKLEEKKEIVLMPALNKKEGDKMTEKVFSFLNTPKQINLGLLQGLSSIK